MSEWLRRLWAWIKQWWLYNRHQPPSAVSNLRAEIDMATATVSWTLPTTREDGAALPIEEIKHTLFSMSADLGLNFSPEVQILPTDPQVFSIGNLSGGTYLFRTAVVDTDDRRSLDADATGDVAIAAPSAIADMTVVIEQ